MAAIPRCPHGAAGLSDVGPGQQRLPFPRLASRQVTRTGPEYTASTPGRIIAPRGGRLRAGSGQLISRRGRVGKEAYPAVRQQITAPRTARRGPLDHVPIAVKDVPKTYPRQSGTWTIQPFAGDTSSTIRARSADVATPAHRAFRIPLYRPHKRVEPGHVTSPARPISPAQTKPSAPVSASASIRTAPRRAPPSPAPRTAASGRQP